MKGCEVGDIWAEDSWRPLSGRAGLSPPEEAKVASPSVHLTSVARDEACVEVFIVLAVITVDREISAGIVWWLHPNLIMKKIKVKNYCIAK